jgi:hypothetical protein
MRPLLASIALLASAAAPAHAAELRFERVWVQWHDADSFQSFYEYRTGRELEGNWTILRTQADNRAGIYFLARTENPGAPTGATIVIRVISPESIDVRTYSFPVEVPAGSKLFVVGLTGTDWTAGHTAPVAWDFELQAADGALLAKKTSFLWEKPGR